MGFESTLLFFLLVHFMPIMSSCKLFFQTCLSAMNPSPPEEIKCYPNIPLDQHSAA